MRVERDHEELVAEHGEASVDEAATGGEIGRKLAAVPPDLTAGSCIECPGHVLWTGDVEDVVSEERRRLEVAECGGLKGPLRNEPLDVGRRDLGERAVSLVGVASAKGEPARAVTRQPFRNLLARDERRRRTCCAARIALPPMTTSETRWLTARYIAPPLATEPPPDRNHAASADSGSDRRGRSR